VFDESHGVVLLVNGVPEDATEPHPLELWSWDGSTWSLVAADPAGPVGRNFAAVAYNSARDVLVVHGGQAGATTFGDTLEWDGTEWRVAVVADGPGPRSSASLTYDAAAGVAVLYGGDSQGELWNDTWTWDGETWTQVAQDGPQPVRWPAMFEYDQGRGEVVLYGGHQVIDPDGPPSVGDTWVWDGDTWRLAEAQSAPGALVNAAGAYDPGLARLMLVGGSDMVDLSTEVWTWTGETWEPLASDAFPARQGHGLAYDESRHVVVLTGGVVTPGQLDRYQDLWEWDGDAPAVREDG